MRFMINDAHSRLRVDVFGVAIAAFGVSVSTMSAYGQKVDLTEAESERLKALGYTNGQEPKKK